MIYLASPYSHPDGLCRQIRFELVCTVAARLMKDGKHVFSPIAHTHPIALAGDLPKVWDYWESFDRKMLSACSEVIVLKLDGWEQSKGIAAELVIAKELGKPISFMEYE